MHFFKNTVNETSSPGFVFFWLKVTDLFSVPAAVFLSHVEIIQRDSGGLSSSCSQCSLWDFCTPILLIHLSWYLLRATLFYWDFMGEMFYMMNEKQGMFWNKRRVFTRGVVKNWVWLSTVGDRMSFVFDAVASIEHYEGMSANLQWIQIFFLSSEPAASSSLVLKSSSLSLYHYPRRLTVPFITLRSETLVSVQPSHQHLSGTIDILKIILRVVTPQWIQNLKKLSSRLRGTFQILSPHLETRTKLWVCPCKSRYVYTAILCVLCCASKWEINGKFYPWSFLQPRQCHHAPSFYLNVYVLGVLYSTCIYAEAYIHTCLFCISSVIERNPQFCDLFLIKWPKQQGKINVKPYVALFDSVWLLKCLLVSCWVFSFTHINTVVPNLISAVAQFLRLNVPATQRHFSSGK